MTVEYEFAGETEHLTDTEKYALEDKLSKTRYEFHFNGSRLDIVGYCDIDEYSYTPDDVEDDIKWLVHDYDVDLDGRACQVEFEPDWDKMHGGYDYIHN